MAGPKFYSRKTNPQAANVWGSVIQSGAQSANNQANQMIKQQHDYSQALQQQREFEMREEKKDYELAKEAVNSLSEKFPMGDQKSENDYQLYMQTDQYKELTKHIKKGMPWAVKDGEIQRLPKYKAQKARLDYEMAALEERVRSGNASEDDKLAYVRGKAMTQLHDKAVSKAQDTEGFDRKSPAEQSDMIANFQNILFNSAVSSLGNSGKISMEQESQGSESAPFSIKGAINPFVQALSGAANANQGEVMAGPSGVGADISSILGQKSPEGVPQGMVPVQANQQQPDPLTLAKQIMAKRKG